MLAEPVKTAVSNLFLEPCPAFKAKTIAAVEAATEADRRMAITEIEHFLQNHTEQRYSPVVDTLIALRRAGV
jgi:hypothetical protein